MPSEFADKPAPRCDLCGVAWTEERQPQAMPYGPFTVWYCAPCAAIVSPDGAA
jgi:hypothetical protein